MKNNHVSIIFDYSVDEEDIGIKDGHMSTKK